MKIDIVDFHIISGRNKDVYTHIIKNNKDTITITDATGGVEIRDFNNDHYPDIILCYLGNVYSCDLYLFDNQTDNFYKVAGFNHFSDCKIIDEKSNLFYSYQATGCANANWKSSLFKIDNFEIQELGRIEANECKGDNQDNKIMIMKIDSLDKVIPIDTLPIEKYNGNKWNFISDYWANNVNEFKK